MFGGSNLSLADIAAVTKNNGDGDGLGNGNGWWVLIILFALFGGWGNNGYGRNNGDNANGSNGGTNTVVIPYGGYGCSGGFGGWGAFDAASLQRGFDTSGIVTKLDGIANGICGLGYDQLSQMNGINSTIMQTGFGLQQSINADTVANMQNTNALSRQLADCCCENRQGQAQIMNQMATDACALKTAIFQSSQEIMQNDNANFRSLNDTIRDGFTALAMNQKDQQIQDLRDRLSQQSTDCMMQRWAQYTVDQVRPMPGPCYPVENPWGCNCSNGWNSWGRGGCGNNGCCN